MVGTPAGLTPTAMQDTAGVHCGCCPFVTVWHLPPSPSESHWPPKVDIIMASFALWPIPGVEKPYPRLSLESPEQFRLQQFHNGVEPRHVCQVGRIHQCPHFVEPNHRRHIWWNFPPISPGRDYGVRGRHWCQCPRRLWTQPPPLPGVLSAGSYRRNA